MRKEVKTGIIMGIIGEWRTGIGYTTVFAPHLVVSSHHRGCWRWCGGWNGGYSVIEGNYKPEESTVGVVL